MLLSHPASAGPDNSALLPPWRPDDQVALEGTTPDWVKSLVITQFRIETATPEGTFASATRVLDHYAALGVNGLWINPIYERGSKDNGYINFGPDTFEPLITGAATADGSLSEIRKFVDQAHLRNIRIFFDIVVWGTAKHSPLVTNHPEFYERREGAFREVWSGYAFDWTNPKFRSWFKSAAIHLIETTGADGFRVDLAPDVSGYFFHEIRTDLLAKGRKIAVISEMPGERGSTFDFEQIGVTGWTEEPDYAHPEKLAEQKKRFGDPHEYLLKNNIVDVVRSGKGIGKAALQRHQGSNQRFYTSNLLCHDGFDPAARGDRITFAYATLFGPFIPMWWIGEEWNNPKLPLPDPSTGGVMYGNTIDWDAAEQPANAAFLNDIQRYLHIRRTYPKIFEHFPDHLRDTNIAACKTLLNETTNPLQAYARTGKNESILIVPNPLEVPRAASVTIDRAALGLKSEGTLSITDLMNGDELPLHKGDHFQADISPRHLGVYRVASK